jgi:hypothetical protein
LPIHGLLKDFVPNTGAYTYAPIRGFRGLDRFTFGASDGQSQSSVATMNLNVVAPADSNGNGLPDAWEAAYGISDPSGDADGDGQSNLKEYLAGTNPTNAASMLKITGIVKQPNGHFDVTWASVGGTRYRLQFGGTNSGAGLILGDLVRPLAQEIDSSAYGSASTQAFTDDFTLTGGAPTNGVRFYRIKVVP